MNFSVKEFWKKHSHLLIALGFTIWGLYLRYVRLARRDLWLDEHSQIQNMLGPFQSLWQRAYYGELTCFPGDYLLSYLFINWAPENKWIVMIPHMVATVISFGLLYLICRRYMKTVWGTLAAFLVFTYNTNLIYHAFEMRPYAVLIVLGLAVFYCAEMIIDAQYRLSRLQKFLIGVLFFVTIQFHAYGISIVFFPTIFFIFKEWGRLRSLGDVIRHIFKFYAILGAFALPVWLWYVSGTLTFSPIDTFQFIPDPRNNPVGFLKGVFGNLIGDRLFYPLLAGMIAAFLIQHKERWIQVGFFLILAAAPIALLFWVDVVKQYWFLQRQFTWVMPLFAFFLGWCLDSVLVWARDKGKRAAPFFE